MSVKWHKVVVVCNSTNSDLVQYFLEEVNYLKSHCDYLTVFSNRKIIVDSSYKCYTSSITNKSFFDIRLFIDFFISVKLLFVLFLNGRSIVHFTTAHVSNLFLSIPLKIFGFKLLFTIHDLEPHPGFKSFFIRIYNNFVVNIIADNILTFSKGAVCKSAFKNKMNNMLLSGFEQNISTPKVGNKTILFFGRIDKYKGLGNLYDLCVKCLVLKLDYKFIVAGKGSDPYIKELKLLSNVEIVNRYIDKDELLDLFSTVSFVILPYDSATQSGVAIVSYSYATPVIAFNVGFLSEYIDDSLGLIVNHKDIDAIVNYLLSVSDKDIFDKSKNCINVFNEKHSISAYHNYLFEYFKPFIDL